MDNLFLYYETLHRMPERAFQEIKTSAYVEQRLKDMGYTPVRVGETGLYADLCVDPQLPWLVFRADMDALPVEEDTGVSFASEIPGMMHACGHDAHAAMLLTAAEQIYGKTLPQNIRFLFQPAEEITGGAEKMIEAGVLPENTSAVFGFHVWPKVPKGKLVVKAGPLMASSTRVQILCKGKNAHCSKRHEGADALLTAAMIATRFHEAEAAAGGDGTVLFCGKLHSGKAHNIVSDESEMLGTLRTFSQEKWELVIGKLKQIAAETAAQYGTQAEVLTFSYNPAVINHEPLAEKVQQLFPEAIADYEPALAAEDFSRYREKAPAMLLWLGAGDTAALHNGKFLPPREILPIGVNAWLKIANQTW